MLKMVRGAFCAIFLVAQVGASAGDEKSERPSFTSQSPVFESEKGSVNRVVNTSMLQSYLKAQIEFFEQDILQPHFVSTRALYGLLQAVLIKDEEERRASIEILRKKTRQLSEEKLALVNRFLQTVDHVETTNFEFTQNAQGAELAEPPLDLLSAQADPQMQFWEGPQAQSWEDLDVQAWVDLQVQLCKILTSLSDSVLAFTSKYRGSLSCVTFFKGRDPLTFLRQQAALAFHEKAPAAVLRGIICDPQSRDHLAMDVEWKSVLPVLFSPLKEK